MIYCTLEYKSTNKPIPILNLSASFFQLNRNAQQVINMLYYKLKKHLNCFAHLKFKLTWYTNAIQVLKTLKNMSTFRNISNLLMTNNVSNAFEVR